MAAEDALKGQKLLAQGVWDVAYDTPSSYFLENLLQRYNKNLLQPIFAA